MAGIKVRRTLDDRGFKKYMKFCESLKDGSNDALIDTFKYRFAVMEGRIVPKGSRKKRPLTESGLSMGDFETAFKGLVGAFLPHLDEEEQQILGCVCQVMDEKVNGGDIDGAMDALKGAVKDAGGDPDAYEDEEYDDSECEECDDDGCPDGECKVDGECVPCKDAPEAKEECGEKPAAKEECGEKPVTECGETEALAEGVGLLDDPDNDFRDDMYPMDDEPSELDFETGAASPSARYSAEAGEPVTDYDAMADELLRDAGYDDLTVENSGVKRENRKFFGK